MIYAKSYALIHLRNCATQNAFQTFCAVKHIIYLWAEIPV